MNVHTRFKVECNINPST